MQESQEKGTPPTIGMAVYGDTHPVTDDSDEAAEMPGLDFLINTLVNLRGEHCSVYAGAWGKFARAVGATPTQLAPYVNHCILYNEYKFPGSFWPIEPKEKLSQMEKWADVIAQLREWHGDQVRVVVKPRPLGVAEFSGFAG